MTRLSVPVPAPVPARPASLSTNQLYAILPWQGSCPLQNGWHALLATLIRGGFDLG